MNNVWQTDFQQNAQKILYSEDETEIDHHERQRTTLMSAEDEHWMGQQIEQLPSVISLSQLAWLFREFYPIHYTNILKPDSTCCEFIETYVRMKYLVLYGQQLCGLDGSFDWHLPVLGIHGNINELRPHLNDFLAARNVLSTQDCENFLVYMFDTTNYGPQHVRSFNALVHQYIPYFLRQMPPIVVEEQPWSLADDIVLLRSSNIPLSASQIIEIATRCNVSCTSLSAKMKRENLAKVLELQQRFWNKTQIHVSSSGRHLVHRLVYIGVRWGTATSVGDMNEHKPSHPQQALLADTLLFASAMAIIMRYEVFEKDKSDKILFSRENHVPVCMFPLLVRSVLDYSARLSYEISVGLRSNFDDVFNVVISKGIGKITESVENRIANHPLVFKNDLRCEIHSSNEPDMEGGQTLSVSFLDPSMKKKITSINNGENNSEGDGSGTDNSKNTGSGGDQVLLVTLKHAQPISIVILFAAYGITNLREMEDKIVCDIHDETLQSRARQLLAATWNEFSGLLQFANKPPSERGKKFKLASRMQEEAWVCLASTANSAAEIRRSQNNNYGQYYFRGTKPWLGPKADEFDHVHYLLTSVYFPHIGIHNFDHPYQQIQPLELWGRKAEMLAFQCKRIVYVWLGIDNADEHDFCGHKRAMSTGMLFFSEWCEVFRDNIHPLVKREVTEAALRHSRLDLETLYIDVTEEVRKKTSNIRRKVDGSGSKNAKEDKGVQGSACAKLDRTNRLASASQVRKMHFPMYASSKSMRPRAHRHTMNKIYDPSQTPDNNNAGLIRFNALLHQVSTTTNSWPIARALLALPPEVFSRDFSLVQETNSCLLFLNGDPLGRVRNASLFMNIMNKLKRSTLGMTEIDIVPVIGDGCVGAILSPDPDGCMAYASFLSNNSKTQSVRSIGIFTEAGRMIVPHFVVNPQKNMPFFEHGMMREMDVNPSIHTRLLLETGFLEYLNTQSENQLAVATCPDDMLCNDVLRRMNHVLKPPRSKARLYSHSAIHPAALSGVVVNCIPLPNNSYAPRLQFGANMLCQNINTSEDLYQAIYPERVLFRTIGNQIIRESEYGTGTNINFAILSHFGTGQEDALENDKRLIQQHHMSTVMQREYKQEVGLDGHKTQRLENPSLNRNERITVFENPRFDRQFLEVDGLPAIGTMIDGRISSRQKNHRRPVVINCVTEAPVLSSTSTLKTTTTSETTSETTYKNGPIIPIRRDECGRVTSVVRLQKTGFRELVRVVVREFHEKECGDKSDTPEAHKTTQSKTVDSRNMPICCDPNICIQSCIEPSCYGRMLVNMYDSSALSFLHIMTGREQNATAFTPRSNTDSIFVQHGHSPFMYKPVCCGITGKLLHNPVPILHTCMMELRYFARNKCARRGIGVVDSYTRQPPGGRSLGGGNKTGWMEKDLHTCHGAGKLDADVRINRSARTIVVLCETCGQYGYIDKKTNTPMCFYCKEGNNRVNVVIQGYGSSMCTRIVEAYGQTIARNTKRQEIPVYQIPASTSSMREEKQGRK